MGYGVMTAQDQRMAFVYSKDIFSMGVAKLKMFFYERGAYRDDRMGHLSLGLLRRFIKERINSQGWSRLGSLSGDLATVRFLEYCGFRDVSITEGDTAFTCSVVIFGKKFDRETFGLPVWLQFFLWQEKLTNRAGLSNQALLSVWDTAKLLYEHWLYENHMVSAEQIAHGAITAAKIRHDFNVAEDKRVEAQLAASGITTQRHYAAEDGIS